MLIRETFIKHLLTRDARIREILFHFATVAKSGCKKAEDTNYQSETLSSMIQRDRGTGDSLYFGMWYFDPRKLIKIRFHLTDRRRDGNGRDRVEGSSRRSHAPLHVEIEFDDASCSWNFRERELIGNESIWLQTQTFLPVSIFAS